MATGSGLVLGLLVRGVCTSVHAAATGGTVPATMLGANVVSCEAGRAAGVFADGDGGRS
jgi:hypothetical protein